MTAEPHTIWWWDDRDGAHLPVPNHRLYDTRDEAVAAAKAMVEDAPVWLAWVKVFRADNEAYEAFRWSRDAAAVSPVSVEGQPIGYREGFDAYHAGVGLNDNPMKRHPSIWAEGWIDAKRADEAPVSVEGEDEALLARARAENPALREQVAKNLAGLRKIAASPSSPTGPSEDVRVERALAAFYDDIADTTRGWRSDTQDYDESAVIYSMGNGAFTIRELRKAMAAALTAAGCDSHDG